MTAAYLQPQPQSPPAAPSTNRAPSSRRALTRALELAQEAVRIDASNDDPEAAVLAYAKSVALLSEVMEKVMRGDDSDGNRRKPGSRRRSVVAKEDEARRLRSIHDTYADRMHILTLIYNIPTPTISSLSSALSSPTARSSTTTNSLMVDTESDPAYSAPVTPEPPSTSSHPLYPLAVDDAYDIAEGIGSAFPAAAASPELRSFEDADIYNSTPSVSRASSLHHASRVSNLPPIRPPPAGPPPIRPQYPEPRSRRTSRAAGPPSQPPPSMPPPMAPPPPPPNHGYMSHEHAANYHNFRRGDTTPYADRHGFHIPGETTSWDGHHEIHREEFIPPQPYANPPRRARSGTLDSVTGRRRSPPLPPIPVDEIELPVTRPNSARHPFASNPGPAHVIDDHPYSSSRPVTPASQSVHRPRGNTQSSATSSRSEGDSSIYSDRPKTPPPAVPLLVSTTTAQGTISQRRKSNISMPSGSVDSHLSVSLELPSQPTSRSQSPAVEPHAIPPHPRTPVPVPTSTQPAPPVGRHRALSQPGRRPSIGQLHGPTADQNPPPLPANAPMIPRKTSFTNGFSASRHLDGTPPPQPSGLPPLSLSTPPPTPGHRQISTFHTSPSTQSLPGLPHSSLPPPPPIDPFRRPYYLMSLLHTSISSPTGGYLTKRLHVPHDVWTQGGAKLNNIVDKAKCVAFLEDALDEVSKASFEFMRSNVSANAAGVALSGPGIAQATANRWIRALDEWLAVCDSVVSTFGKKFELGEGGGTVKKTVVWSNKVTRAVDRIANGKNLDSPAQYVQNLSQLFSSAQLFDEHHRALSGVIPLSTYNTLAPEARAQAELKLRKSSEFFSNFVIVFVLRDLGQLLDKYAKKGERWMEE